ADDGKERECDAKIGKAFPTARPLKEQRKEPRQGHPEIAYRVWAPVDDPNKPTSVYHIYATKQGNDLIAIIFHMGKAKATTQDVKAAETYRRQSLLLGADVA